MRPAVSHDVTRLLQAWSEGDEEALHTLTPLVYEQLHSAAQRYMARERSGHTLQTTALIHETYLRLVDIRQLKWQNRAHLAKSCSDSDVKNAQNGKWAAQDLNDPLSWQYCGASSPVNIPRAEIIRR